MTEPEVILWTRLRGRGGERPTFRRQHPFGSVILDFYCPSLKLAVEVDGVMDCILLKIAELERSRKA